MSDEIKSDVAPLKKRGGWPRGKPRGKPAQARAVFGQTPAAPRALPAMRARPNWDDDTIVGVGAEYVDRLKIPQELVEALDRDGMSLQWITHRIRGQDAPQELAKFTKGGWTPVHQSDFGGLLDGLFMSKGDESGPITVEDCLLVARPKAIQQKARAGMLREAREPLRIKEAEIGHGIPGVTGSSHPTVRNSVKKTIERVEIPE